MGLRRRTRSKRPASPTNRPVAPSRRGNGYAIRLGLGCDLRCGLFPAAGRWWISEPRSGGGNGSSR